MFPFLMLALLLAGGVFAVRLVIARRPFSSKKYLPADYISDVSAFKAEYSKYFGATFDDSEIEGRFRQAAEAAGKGSLPGATSILETIVKTAGVPIVFHNLGVGYAGLGDLTRAGDAFREVLARDPGYGPTRKFLGRSKVISAGAAAPFSREQEPNNDTSLANLIALNSPVGAEIAGSNDAADYFKVITPASPRDLITIQLENHSIDFSAHLHVYDINLRMLNWGEKTGRPGESLSVTGGPPPNSVLYVGVSAEAANGGLYLLTVKSAKAFDKYEPNDDLRSAKRITVGEEVSAGIMDGSDSDIFSFQSPRRGTITIDIQNRSETLIPAMTMYNAEHRNLGFAQEQHKAGSNVRYLLDADKDAVYYVQISSQAGTAGTYSLRME